MAIPALPWATCSNDWPPFYWSIFFLIPSLNLTAIWGKFFLCKWLLPSYRLLSGGCREWLCLHWASLSPGWEDYFPLLSIFVCFWDQSMKVSFLTPSLVRSYKFFCIASLWSFCGCNITWESYLGSYPWHLTHCNNLFSNLLPFKLIQNLHAGALSYPGTLRTSPPSCSVPLVPLPLFIQHYLVFILSNLLVSSPHGLSSLVRFKCQFLSLMCWW